MPPPPTPELVKGGLEVVAYPGTPKELVQHVFCAMASHIPNHKRLLALRRCLRSIAEQSVPASLVVSWSTDDDEQLAASVEELFLEYQRRGVVEQAMRQPRPLSQFAHYKKIAELLQSLWPSGEYRSPFIVFTDDDDIWHPCRLLVYASRMITHLENDMVMDAVHVPWYARPKTDDIVSDCANDVNAQIAMGNANVTVETNPAGSEYFLFATRLSVLATFLKDATDALVENRYCDVAFLGFMCRNMDVVDIVSNNDLRDILSRRGVWMYYYTLPCIYNESTADEHCVSSKSVVMDLDRVQVEENLDRLFELVRDVLQLNQIAFSQNFFETLFANNRRNTRMSVTYCYTMTPEQMCKHMLKNVRRGVTKSIEPALVDDITTLHCFIIVISDPIRKAVRDFGMDERGVDLFESECSRRVDAAYKRAAR